MAQIYGNNGSLSSILSEFNKNGVAFLNSLEEMIKFKDNYNSLLSEIKTNIIKSNNEKNEAQREQIKALTIDYETKIKERSVSLSEELKRIDSTLASIKPYCLRTDDVFVGLKNYLTKTKLQKRKLSIDSHFEQEVRRPFSDIYERSLFLNRELLEREKHFQTIVEKEVKNNTHQIMTAKHILEEQSPALLGAIGESKALSVLKKLPDTIFIINNFRYTFPKALHYRQTGAWIQTIQVDHLIISTSGVFVIETKNWSKESVQNSNLFSPVKQTERNSYAIFMLLNRILEHPITLNHHWGEVDPISWTE